MHIENFSRPDPRRYRKPLNPVMLSLIFAALWALALLALFALDERMVDKPETPGAVFAPAPSRTG